MNVEAVHSLPAEFREECAMRVQNPAVKAGQSPRADLLHVACKDDDIHGVLDQYAADRSVQRLGFRMRRTGEVVGGNAGRTCSLKGPRVTVVTDDGHDLGPKHARRIGVDDCLQRRPFVGGENPDPQVCAATFLSVRRAVLAAKSSGAATTLAWPPARGGKAPRARASLAGWGEPGNTPPTGAAPRCARGESRRRGQR